MLNLPPRFLAPLCFFVHMRQRMTTAQSWMSCCNTNNTSSRCQGRGGRHPPDQPASPFSEAARLARPTPWHVCPPFTTRHPAMLFACVHTSILHLRLSTRPYEGQRQTSTCHNCLLQPTCHNCLLHELTRLRPAGAVWRGCCCLGVLRFHVSCCFGFTR